MGGFLPWGLVWPYMRATTVCLPAHTCTSTHSIPWMARTHAGRHIYIYMGILSVCIPLPRTCHNPEDLQGGQAPACCSSTNNSKIPARMASSSHHDTQRKQSEAQPLFHPAVHACMHLISKVLLGFSQGKVMHDTLPPHLAHLQHLRLPPPPKQVPCYPLCSARRQLAQIIGVLDHARTPLQGQAGVLPRPCCMPSSHS